VTKLASCLSHVNQCVLPMKLQNMTGMFHTFGSVVECKVDVVVAKLCDFEQLLDMCLVLQL
jgi:hypothetical protein